MKDLIDKYVGKRAMVSAGGMSVMVDIKDAKMAWGKERYLVAPVMGTGEIWVEAVRLVDNE